MRRESARRRQVPCICSNICVCGWHRRSAVRCPVNSTNNRTAAATELSLRTMPPSLRTGLLQASDLLVFDQLREVQMSKKAAVELISRRRMLGILGAGVAFGMGMPAAVLSASRAEAQTPGGQPPGAQAPGAPTPGVDQRQDRRTDRTQARQERRSDRTNRRVARRNARRQRAMARQEARRQRRMARRTGTRTSTKGTGAPGTTGTGTTGQGPARQ